MIELAGMLRGRRGVIMGMSSENSVGYRCAQSMRDLGAEVTVTYRPVHAERGAALADQLGVRHFGADAGDERSIGSAFERLGAAWDRLDFLVHTVAGVPREVLARPLTEISRADFESALTVGVHSLIAASRFALPLLKRSDHPRIVTLTSAGDTFTVPHYHALGIAKAALVCAVRYLAAELGPHGVLCNAISFSLLPTDGAMRAIGEETVMRTREHLARCSPTGTALDHAQVAAMIAVLASPLWQHTTGQVITQDGGFSQLYLKIAGRRA